jgi:hypothetical protein
MQPYYTICYVSKANPTLTDEEIKLLFSHWASQNNSSEITGILLHSLGNFFQVLEGDEKQLCKLFEKIKKDHRHSDVFTVFNRTTTHPTFLNYDSSFNVVTSKDDLQRIKKYLDENRFHSTNDKLSRLLAPFLFLDEL